MHKNILDAQGYQIQNLKIINNELVIDFTNDAQLKIWDDGALCCNHRYISTDDDLNFYRGANFLDCQVIEINDATPADDEEVAFVRIYTSKGDFTIVNHNEDSGYYGGFLFVTELKQPGCDAFVRQSHDGTGFEYYDHRGF